MLGAEEGFGTSFTDELLSGAESVDLRKIDKVKMLGEAQWVELY